MRERSALKLTMVAANRLPAELCNKIVLPRRQALLVPVGMAGLILAPTVGAAGCETATQLLELIVADIIKFLIDKLEWALSEVEMDGVSGLMTLMNPSQQDASGAADVETLDGNTVVDGASGSYTVPAGMSHTYAWSGPTVPGPGEYQARSRTKIAEALTDKFKVQ